MQARELKVTGAIEFSPRTFPDSRGLFVSPFQGEAFEKAVGHRLTVAQTNHSRSHRATIRGLHFADVPPGQAKYVYCPQGALLDFVVDVRVGSPTYGAWDAVRLDTVDFRAVYVPEGVAHGFVALEDDTVLSYLCSTGYNPGSERGIHPLDPDLALPWSVDEPILSEKDAAAPTLAEAAAAGLLPTYDACLARYADLRG
ncbi:dTDP-4-dehydrorhamnose 3,5-epimerase [Actinokineospora alba]|uniref:dTDP-4-dehydrorhamnose 3,5-epimerase n=1 Tax=Actinokineospora alba TaxID=504798 RepID=A0A1H0UDB3_9PSEU|nr:dTDP-4-dehydrorhamnose 3,5-epimerase family protein [Actinokineospora alba]TDP65178.1 dTDP-4-dehydrorhamnose 3,5-epimerase [Actinokineospora alba]SDH55985.1 dTDP-4-dehydrorhamnose 3,5-epimerase [Actinokineospora alba]SDP64164.1 dTDP-4-dehydrorhamnose 3,5-epimerase [Actinokineospora alba]